MRFSALTFGLVAGALLLGGCGDGYDSASKPASGTSPRPSASPGRSGGEATFEDVDRAMADLVALLGESNDVLASIQDEESARQAAEKMVPIQDRKKELQARLEDLRSRARIGESEGRQLQQKYASRMQEAVERALREGARLQTLPAACAAYYEEAKKLGLDTGGMAGGPAQKAPLTWREFRCPEGGFACEFPGNPTRMAGDVPVFMVDTGDSGYTASYVEVAAGASVDEQLKQAVDSFVSDLTSVETQDLSLAETHPGKLVRGVDSDGDLQMVRMYIAGGRLYQTCVVTSPDKEDAPETLRFLDSFRLLDVIAEALADLRSIERNRRRSAADRLVNYVPAEEKRGEVSAALVPLLSDPDDGTKRSAMKALALWHAPDAVPAMIACLQGATDHWLRSDAIEAVAKVRDERAAEAVAACFADERGRVGAALRAMGPVAQKPVAKYLADPDSGVRSEAIGVIQEIGYDQIVPQVLETLKDADDGVRHRTLDLLKGCTDPQCIAPVAERLLVDRDRGRARDCLISMGPMVEEIVLLGLKHPDPDVFKECCNILGQVGTSKSIPELQRFVRHRDGSIRNAVMAAGRAIVARGAAVPQEGPAP